MAICTSAQKHSLCILLRKNLIILWKSKRLLLFFFLAPILACGFLVYIQMVMNKLIKHEEPEPGVIGSYKLPRCQPEEDCITVGFSIVDPTLEEDEHNCIPSFYEGNLRNVCIMPHISFEEYIRTHQTAQWVNHTLHYVAQTNGLKFGTDIQQITIGRSSRIKDYFLNNCNKTSFGIAFCMTYWDSKYVNIPCHYGDASNSDREMMFYSLIFNSTLASESLVENSTDTMMHDKDLLRLKQSVDNGILDYLSNKNGQEASPRINISSSHYPTPVDRFIEGLNVTAFMGSYWFNLPCIISFLAIVILVINEKEHKLRQGLNVIGVSHKLYWAHWVITGMGLSLINTLTLIISGIAFRVEFFYNTNFMILFIMLFIYNQCLCFTGFTLCTLAPSKIVAYTLCYSIILAALLIQFAFSFDSIVLVLFFAEGTSIIVKIIRTILFLVYPPFTYGILFMQIMRVATMHFNSNYQSFVPGKFFSWGDLLFEEQDAIVTGLKYHVISPLASFGFLLFNLVLYMTLTWYFDHVVTSNRGVIYSKLFCCRKSYWKKLCKNNKDDFYRRYSTDDDSSEIEIRKETSSNQVAIDIKGLTKTYKYCVCSRNFRRVCSAVKPTTLQIFEKELFCILGHNGAGKSTLINMLIGILPPTSNTATLLGLDILEDIEDARRYLGVVPQFDILWENLTVNQNMEIYCGLKNVDPKVTIPEKLVAVNLSDCRTLLVKQMSGGMKRRLSLAMSLIGNPKIIFMDEPTSGMDPVIRKQVWEVIREIKKNCTIVLTTHSMEEAEVLSDRVGIMVSGKFEAVDTSLGLKKRYNEGYKLNLIVQRKNSEEVVELIQDIIPDCLLLSQKGECLIFTLKQEELTEVVNDLDRREFVSLMQKDRISLEYHNKKIERLSRLITQFAISQSTLEEVFTIINKPLKPKIQAQDTTFTTIDDNKY
ncbi:unnamed protein product [Moneuplotes crassus]|uniref:ABC transporter domain-containing protein n=1 Tax=Euplotes crassus TaxID=5936 RepID=A0AAD1Y205_EUPCR|nr:unnamed protein product [Moneuplotes crassus]